MPYKKWSEIKKKTPSSDLELVHAAIEGIDSGSISWSDLAKIFAGEPEKVQEKYKQILPAKITEKQDHALELLPMVFGSVVPTEFRELNSGELSALLQEREVLDEVKKLADNRREQIRTTILNHFDVKNKDQISEDTPRDKDGHYLKSDSVVVRGKKFTWEVNDPDPIINQNKLEGLLTEDEWMHVTVDTRVFDEEKAMDYLKIHPELMDKIVQSVETPKPVGRFNVRDHHE